MKKVPVELFPPVLLGIFFTLSLYSQNIALVPLQNLWIPLLLAAVAGLFLFFLFMLMFHSKGKASIVSSLLMGVIFSYGYSAPVSLALLGSIFVVAFWSWLRKYLERSAILVVTVIILGMLLLPSFNIAMSLRDKGTNVFQASQVTPVAGAPDIYYIIFDSYAGGKSLQEIGFDNSDLYAFLKDDGFYIADQSYCNYPRTYLSLAASLNMSYLNSDGDVVGYSEAVQMIKNNQVVKFLKDRGYEYYNVGSEAFLPTATNGLADKNFEYKVGNPVYNEFSMTLYSTTVFNKLFKKNWSPDLMLSERDGILYQLDILGQIARNNAQNDRPVFTFCHILLPHHSETLFNADGTYPTGSQLNRSIEDNYINKITYLNTRIKELAGEFLVNPENPPIIIFQSDEGISSTEFTNLTQNRFDQEQNLPDNVIRQRAYILNAIYLPGGPGDSIYPTLSPVNIFRVIFNRYFDQSYDLLPDKFFFPKIYANTGDGSPSSEFYDATDLLK